MLCSFVKHNWKNSRSAQLYGHKFTLSHTYAFAFLSLFRALLSSSHSPWKISSLDHDIFRASHTQINSHIFSIVSVGLDSSFYFRFLNRVTVTSHRKSSGLFYVRFFYWISLGIVFVSYFIVDNFVRYKFCTTFFWRKIKIMTRIWFCLCGFLLGRKTILFFTTRLPKKGEFYTVESLTDCGGIV